MTSSGPDDDPPRIARSSIRMGTRSTADEINPTTIRHQVDSFEVPGDAPMRYRYLEYEFDGSDAFCRARAYTDSMGEVAFYGPFAARDDLTVIEAPEFRESVLDYLRRRFNRITAPDERGYVTIWSS